MNPLQASFTVFPIGTIHSFLVPVILPTMAP